MTTPTPETTVHALLTTHPFLLDFLAGYRPEFAVLKNPAIRGTMGRVATLERVAEMAGIPVADLLRDLSARIASEGGSADAADADGGAVPDRGRIERLKQIIRALHENGEDEAARADFARLLGEVEPNEIARMEQELIAEGLPVTDIHRLCDLHVNVFRTGLDTQAAVEAPPGHPLHTYRLENEEIGARAQRWADACRLAADGEADTVGLREALDALAAVERHYTRKENQLFPYLEKHGFTGPSQVMWALHDDVRGMIKDLRAALDRNETNALRETGAELARVVSEMIYKEEKILFPNAWTMVTDDEWRAIRAGDEEIGYVVPPAATWPPDAEPGAAPAPPSSPGDGASDAIPLTTGALTHEQLDRMLLAMPIEFSFVDAEDTVRYYSGQAERVFPRSPGVIGRKVQNCHPPKSIDQVNAILQAFRDGSRDRAEFWIPFQEKFLYITYHAVRDAAGRYLGTLEVTMDASHIRALTGERRLLEWS